MGSYTRIVSDGIPAPTRRPLKIFSNDPMAGRDAGNRARIDVPNEPLRPGPIGRRIAVIDYDGTRKRFYRPVDLNNPAILLQGGLDPSESDPRFHQQMVYAVASRTIENFDQALGRPIKMSKRKHKVLRIFPHAFYGANAFYAPDLNAVLFGYFRADDQNPGRNMPGQVIYTCLSHDVIAHEITHKVVDRLRPRFMEASNEDVRAFHEGFADIVALFQHFSFPDVLRHHIAQTRADLRTPTSLVELAQQFGSATGRGKALRSAIDKPDAKLYETLLEPHSRGAILVAAVFDGFFTAYQSRTQDLIRIATGGSGILPSGRLPPDLVNRIAMDTSRVAQRVLDMCIRAFDYLPPVDITFGDFLRAMVTADYELVPEDDLNVREAMIEAFRVRGIFPVGVHSLAQESLLWPSPRGLRLPPEIREPLQELFFSVLVDLESGEALGENEEPSEVRSEYQRFYDQKNVQQMVLPGEGGGADIEVDVSREMVLRLHTFANKNREVLGLSPGPIQIMGFHPSYRVSPSRRLVAEIICQFAQKDDSRTKELGGLPLRGGTTMVASADGTVRYVVRKPMPSPGRKGEIEDHAGERLARQERYVAMCDMMDPMLTYMGKSDYAARMAMTSFAHLHEV